MPYEVLSSRTVFNPLTRVGPGSFADGARTIRDMTQLTMTLDQPNLRPSHFCVKSWFKKGLESLGWWATSTGTDVHGSNGSTGTGSAVG